MTITALAVYQAWLCPQVWCCSIHYEEFSLLDSSENYPLIGCVHHANTHQDGQLVMNLLLAETILFKYMLSSTFLELSGHPDMDLIPCSKRLIVVSSMFFSMDSSQFVKSNHERKCIGIINDVHNPYSCGEVRIWASKQMVPQSILVGASFQHSFKCNNVITSLKSHSHVGDDKPKWRYENILQVQHCPSIAVEVH